MSLETRDEIEKFYAEEQRNLDRIQKELRARTFKFDPGHGIAKRRAGKKPRPIVVASVRNRIVQRAILDVLQEQPSIHQEFLNTPTSFGGIKGRAVKHAIKCAQEAVANGSKYYASSDIKEFYRNIPRDTALSIIEEHIADEEFRKILRDAATTELDNLPTLGEHASLFPLDETGVAQGCSLSTIVGNALLRKFDDELNARKIVCLRYIDDFIVLGPSRDSVRKAFLSSLRILKQYGLDAYDPWEDEGKGHRGHTDKPFEFLGCEIDGECVRPSGKKINELFSKIDRLLSVSKQTMRTPAVAYRRNLSFVPTLNRLSSILRGWGRSYDFCTDREVFLRIDEFVDRRIRDYFAFYTASVRRDPKIRGLMRGVYLMAPCDEAPRESVPRTRDDSKGLSSS
ncbi:reverse transcriptase domain-containing protein [Sorangium sp. So ce204]|uniref:reverse transcriptase domain-containing protein n=1 Tax=Sorangium sp. So ce204 TaxID=3133288 RepID=UPI003F647B83